MDSRLRLVQDKYCSGEPYVKVSVAGEYFGISVWTLYRLAESGKVPSHKIGGKRRFKISELEATFKR